MPLGVDSHSLNLGEISGIVMEEYSVLIGGQAGDGIRQAGVVIGRIFSRMGYYAFVYDDYPSVIRGSHNFSVVRAADERMLGHRTRVDAAIALNEETNDRHRWRLYDDGLMIYDSGEVEGAEGLGIPMKQTTKEKKYPLLTRNSYAIGALAGAFDVPLGVVEDTLKATFRRYIEENVELAGMGHQQGSEVRTRSVTRKDSPPRPLMTGNEAIALGAVKAGLKMYVAYPMTPTSAVLHYLAAHEDELNVVTAHPENEIAVAIMAIGAAYAGVRTMVGTAGGGFALMNEAFSLTGQSEVPVVFVVGQRPAPSTGVPTYTAQADLLWTIRAGHGEFVRVVVAPGDVDEAFYLAGRAMNLAWKYQIPAVILLDKHLAESNMTAEFDEDLVEPDDPLLWDGRGEYKRYTITEDGVSPLAFPGTPGIVVKGTSKEHDEHGITTEDAGGVARMQEKRFAKSEALLTELRGDETVKVYGLGDVALITWGSTKGAAVEVASRMGLRVIQPLYVEPFPTWAVMEALEGVETTIDVEVNLTGQLATILEREGIRVDSRVLRYDGRPFTADELEEGLGEVT